MHIGLKSVIYLCQEEYSGQVRQFYSDQAIQIHQHGEYYYYFTYFNYILITYIYHTWKKYLIFFFDRNVRSTTAFRCAITFFFPPSITSLLLVWKEHVSIVEYFQIISIILYIILYRMLRRSAPRSLVEFTCWAGFC